jgi:hypothetical protein
LWYTKPFEYCPFDDSNHLFCAISEHAILFDDWPGLNKLEYKDRPFNIIFGDGQEFTEAEL